MTDAITPERRAQLLALKDYSRAPWRVVTDYPALAIAARNYVVVQTANRNNFLHYGPAENWMGVSGESNGALIAAAPELLALARQQHGRIVELEAKRDAAEERGAKRMRERAVDTANRYGGAQARDIACIIRVLPLRDDTHAAPEARPNG